MEHAVPDIQGRQEVGGLIRIPVVDAVGILTLVVRAFTWVLQAQERHDHEHLGQKIRRTGFRGLDNHTSQTHVDGDARQLTTGMGERHLAALAADGLELGELIETVRHGLHIRRIDEPSSREYRRIAMPSATRPHRPDLWSALAWLIGSIGRR